MFGFENNRRALEARQQARGKDCLQASMIEVGAKINPDRLVPGLEELNATIPDEYFTDRGTIDSLKSMDAIEFMANRMGIEVTNIETRKIPLDEIPKESIVLLGRTGVSSGHVESMVDDGDRVAKFLENGCQVNLIYSFRKKQ